MKTPDRFDTMVRDLWYHGKQNVRDMSGLLRRQHRAYVQLVKGHSHGEATRGWVSTATLLAAFARYQKGKKP